MFTIKLRTLKSGWIAFLFERPEYWECGKTDKEAFGNLIMRLIEDTLIDTIEIQYIDDLDKIPDAELIRKLNGEI